MLIVVRQEGSTAYINLDLDNIAKIEVSTGSHEYGRLETIEMKSGIQYKVERSEAEKVIRAMKERDTK